MKKKKIILGVALLTIGIINANLTIDTTWHYFANGIVSGIGVSLIFFGIKKKKKS